MRHTPDRRQTLQYLGAALAAMGLPVQLAQAQSGTVKFILPNATGSGVDAITRTMAPVFGRLMGVNVVVENQAGASGVIGLQAMGKTPPDGNTLSVVSNNVVIFPSVIKNLPFDMPGDFTAIATLGNTPMVLVANPQKINASNSREFIAALKAKPDGYNFGSGGTGTILHLAAEMFLDETNTRARHIPYKGVGPMVTDLLGGQIDFGVLALPSIAQHIKSGAVRAIGMCADKRTAAMPEVPTFVEQGVAGYAVEAWFGLLGPKGMAPAQVSKIHAAIVATFNDPAIKEAMAKQGNTISITSPEQASRTFRSEMERFARLVKKVGIEPQ
ncbi:MAG: hypothetical protein RIQ97_1133 [Pseudomonadota bacterium]|jgi:tripartite-type tricarboxylate transporter receptor subunit TctC